jgi:hypothetical protein
MISDADLAKEISDSNASTMALISILEDIIEMETASLEANKIVDNEAGCLANEYRLTHAQLLLRGLRMKSLFPLP